MRPNQAVEVRLRFDGRWAGGFTVAELRELGSQVVVRVRRASDGAVLPESFAEEEVRAVES